MSDKGDCDTCRYAQVDEEGPECPHLDTCQDNSKWQPMPQPHADDRTELREAVREVLAELLGADVEGLQAIEVWGAPSVKALGETVREAGLAKGLVLLDLRRCRTIGGRRPWWRP